MAKKETSAESWLPLRTARFPLSLCTLAARHSLSLKELQRTPPPSHMMHVDSGASFTARPLDIESLFAVALCVAYTFAYRCGIAALTAPVV